MASSAALSYFPCKVKINFVFAKLEYISEITSTQIAFQFAVKKAETLIFTNKINQVLLLSLPAKSAHCFQFLLDPEEIE